MCVVETRATDTAGNISTTGSRAFSIDTTAPTFTFSNVTVNEATALTMSVA